VHVTRAPLPPGLARRGSAALGPLPTPALAHDPLLRHGRDVHPAWVNVVTVALALKSFGGQVMRAEVMLESREGSGF
jgi:hypothetical protein